MKKDTKQAKEGPNHFSKAGQFILIYLKALYWAVSLTRTAARQKS